MNYRVFVYGTLRKGESNHHYLKEGLLIEDEVWAKGYTMYDLVAYPFAVPTAVGQIKGEIWQIDERCLAKIDKLEGIEEGLYTRIFDNALQAYIYVRPNSKGLVGIPQITQGDWKMRLRR
ncbi:MAG: gamma-glutamylcyclotransferase [Thermoflexibacter sp.]